MFDLASREILETSAFENIKDDLQEQVVNAPPMFTFLDQGIEEAFDFAFGIEPELQVRILSKTIKMSEYLQTLLSSNKDGISLAVQYIEKIRSYAEKLKKELRVSYLDSLSLEKTPLNKFGKCTSIKPTAQDQKLCKLKEESKDGIDELTFPDISHKLKLDIKDFKELGSIGETLISYVKKCFHIPTGREVALKYVCMKYNKKEKNLNNYQLFARSSNLRKEVDAQRALIYFQHENVLSFYGYTIIDKKLIMCLELMNTNLTVLYNYVHKIEEEFPEKLLGIIGKAILNGLVHFQEHGIIHRDIKPLNILVNSKGEIKIADFGAATIINEADKASTWSGTIAYMPPEMADGKVKKFDIRRDVWGLGMTLAEMALGSRLHNSTESSEDVISLLQKIKTFDSKTLNEEFFNLSISSKTVAFLQQCLSDLENRPFPKKLKEESQFYRYYNVTFSYPSRDIAQYVIKLQNLKEPRSRKNMAEKEQKSRNETVTFAPNINTEYPPDPSQSLNSSRVVNEDFHKLIETKQEQKNISSLIHNQSLTNKQAPILNVMGLPENIGELEPSIIPGATLYADNFRQCRISKVYELAGAVLLYNHDHVINEFKNIGIKTEDAEVMYKFLVLKCKEKSLWDINKIKGIAAKFENGLRNTFDDGKHREGRYVLSMTVGQYMVFGKNYNQMYNLLAQCTASNSWNGRIINELSNLCEDF